MKFAHISDLHLGKRVNQFSLLEDQKEVLKNMIEIFMSENIDGVLIAGDIYDKSVPSAEAVSLFDEFLVQLSREKIAAFVISGNHDSAERVAFGARIMNQSGIYLSSVYNGSIENITMQDEFGEVNVWLLPFVKPVHVRHFYPYEEIYTYTDAISSIIRHMGIDKTKRNILVAHQFVAGATRCDSEELSVGGIDSVSAEVFEDFDYVALGHIHGPQNIKSEKIRYCGTPMKYSFSEATHIKSITILDIREKGVQKIKTIPLCAGKNFIKVKGYFEDIISPSSYEKTDTQAYVQVTLLDEQDIVNAFQKLRGIYPNLMKMEYDNLRTRMYTQSEEVVNAGEMSPMELFEIFYEKMNHQSMTDEQKQYLLQKIEKIQEEME